VITASIKFGDTPKDGLRGRIEIDGGGRNVRLVIHPTEQGREEPMSIYLEKDGVLKLISDLAQASLRVCEYDGNPSGSK
jgi:hypothetical protein